MSEDCATAGFANVQAAWQRYETDHAFHQRVDEAVHNFEHLTWPTGEDGPHQMMTAAAATALLTADLRYIRVVNYATLSGAARALRRAAAMATEPMSSVLHSFADLCRESADRIRSRT